jgi:hypothetical protein
MALPEGLQFLKLRWWAIHVPAVLLPYSFAYRKGCNDERRARSEGSWRLGAARTRRPSPYARYSFTAE